MIIRKIALLLLLLISIASVDTVLSQNYMAPTGSRLVNEKLFIFMQPTDLGFIMIEGINTVKYGSRDDPLPKGTSLVMNFDDSWHKGDNWEITVLDVFPNATTEMIYGKPYEEFVRDPGTELLAVKIQAKYIGPKSNYFNSDYLKVVGSASVGYSPINHIQAEGEIPNFIPSREVFTGGVITGIVVWMIPPAHANHLVMYNSARNFDDRIYMALF